MSKSLLRLLAILLAFGLIAAACGDDDDDDATTTEEATEATVEEAEAEEAEEPEAEEEAAEEETAEEGASIDLASVCPAEIIIQTDWNPESEHGALYQMVGKDGYTIDAGSAIVSGDLVIAGEDSGVDI